MARAAPPGRMSTNAASLPGRPREGLRWDRVECGKSVDWLLTGNIHFEPNCGARHSGAGADLEPRLKQLEQEFSRKERGNDDSVKAQGV